MAPAAAATNKTRLISRQVNACPWSRSFSAEAWWSEAFSEFASRDVMFSGSCSFVRFISSPCSGFLTRGFRREQCVEKQILDGRKIEAYRLEPLPLIHRKGKDQIVEVPDRFSKTNLQFLEASGAPLRI